MNHDFSWQINHWLGAMSHQEIVTICYIMTTIILATFVFLLLFEGRRLKKKLQALEAKNGNTGVTQKDNC